MFCPEEENKKEPEIEENKDVNEEPKKEGNVKIEIKRENDSKEIENSKNITLCPMKKIKKQQKRN